MVGVTPLRIGISQCLLGEQVRFDGGHKRDGFLADTLSRYVEWVPVCPEVETGLGVPREAMRLERSATSPRFVRIYTGVDHTRAMVRFSNRRLRELEALDLCGYVFKARSPSCGIGGVPIYTKRSAQGDHGAGLFARVFMKHFPLIPVEDDDRLHDSTVREQFIERVFCYRRWRDLLRGRITHNSIVAFHTAHQYLVLAHSRPHYRALGRLVANGKRSAPRELARRYGLQFMDALKVPTRIPKHVTVLHQLLGLCSDRVSPREKRSLEQAIQESRQGLVPVAIPIRLLKHFVSRLHILSLEQQIYLNPHPTELLLRNQV